jgi:hypothetical protein
MKKIILFTLALFIATINTKAQTNNSLIVFAEGGERFYLILNGLKQNEVASSNVKAINLNQPVYKAKAIFEKQGIPDLDKSFYMMDGGTEVSNKEFVISISKDKKGKYKFKLISVAPNGTNTQYQTVTTNPVNTNTDNTQTTTNVNTNGTTTTTNVGITDNTTMSTNIGVNGGTNTTTTSTTTNTNGTTGVNVGINVGGTGLNMNVNVTDPLLNGAGTNTTTTTTTTYTSSTTSGGGTTGTTETISTNINGNGTNTTVNTNNTLPNNAGSNSSTVNNSTSSCIYPMGTSDFETAKKSIVSKSFEDSKLTLAKQIINSNCMNTAQVKSIMKEFSFEETKLTWAKHAYPRVTDKNNYFQINDGFSFESTIEDLNEFINSSK